MAMLFIVERNTLNANKYLEKVSSRQKRTKKGTLFEIQKDIVFVEKESVVFQYVNFKEHKQNEYLLSDEDYNAVIQHVQENGLCMV